MNRLIDYIKIHCCDGNNHGVKIVRSETWCTTSHLLDRKWKD